MNAQAITSSVSLGLSSFAYADDHAVLASVVHIAWRVRLMTYGSAGNVITVKLIDWLVHTDNSNHGRFEIEAREDGTSQSNWSALAQVCCTPTYTVRIELGYEHAFFEAPEWDRDLTRACMPLSASDPEPSCKTFVLPATEHCTLAMSTVEELTEAGSTGICLIHPSLIITSRTSLFFWFLILVFAGVAYEYLRLITQRYDQDLLARLSAEGAHRRDRLGVPGNGRRATSPLLGQRTIIPYNAQIARSALYVANVAVSFALMLLVMTYNSYVIAAVLIGAFVGHLIFQRDLTLSNDGTGKGMACH
ncbi:hypothetical protein E5Q_02675 [Mixia osmundae IAM 14324]|uniref:Copper transport protein n=1 Tax=Mixia osmundae (strain CBS 9802 / IAM 14324 / JCM 22182 / KY 12970) TaxID=764103 RepID=G7DZK5_MIXOS|nr:hypothetical protein E5Q_02675 [Mixia osmundae IAM 14324]